MKAIDQPKSVIEYYNSKEAKAFHSSIYGGEYVHIGTYRKPSDSIAQAAEQAVKTMIRLLPKIAKNTSILELGSGYGGAARFLANKYNCKISCLNISEKENERHVELNKKHELDEYIEVTTGNFEQIPFARESFDIVWSQDALFHSAKREKVFREVARVLKPEGRFIFTDPMKTDDCPDGALKNLLSLHQVKSLSTKADYRRIARKADLELVFTKEMPEQLVTHYNKVLDSVEKQYNDVVKKTSKEYVDEKLESAKNWISAGEKGQLNWGILQFQKRNI